LGIGTIAFQTHGSIVNGSFVEGSNPDRFINVFVSTSDTLNTVAAKINQQQGANPAVTASVVTDASGARLVVTSNSTGSNEAFTGTTSGYDDASFRENFTFDPVAAQSGTNYSTLSQSAANATATINGLVVTSSTNTLSGVLSGVTLNLNAVGGPVDITVGTDTTAIKASIQTFVDSYNALATLLAKDTKYDAASGTAASLQGDKTAVSLQRQLRSILGSSSAASSAFSSLSQAGLQIQADGTIKINDTTLNNAIANPTQLKALFAATNVASPGDSGFARRFQTLGDSALGLNGLLDARLSGLNGSLTKNQKDQDSTNRHLSAIEAQLRAQYSALDSKMAGINALSTYVTQQIANWNKPAA
jgi:flagellar hook-associated protein 2